MKGRSLDGQEQKAVKKTKVFYGYWILASCFMFCLINSGCGFGAFTLSIKSLEAAFGWSRTEIMAAFTILIIVGAITSPFAGRVVERFGARRVISAGSLIGGIGLVLLSQMSDLWHFYFGYLLVGVGLTATGPLTSSYVVSHWFHRRRGRAMGIMALGMGASSLVFVPLIGIYLIPHFGWSKTYVILGAILAGTIIPLSLFVIRTKPADMGLHSDGGEGFATDKATIENTKDEKQWVLEGVPASLAVGMQAFWLIGLSLVLNHTHLGVLVSVFPHLRDIGFSANVAVSALSVQGVMSFLGMFFFGWICDKMRPKFAAGIGLFLLALGTGTLLFIKASSPTGLIWAFAIVMGFGVGSWMPTMSMLTSSTFGMASYGSIFGMMSVFQNFGGATGPLITGYVYDRMHSYQWAFGIILIMIVLAIPLVLAVSRPVSKIEYDKRQNP